MNKVYQMSDLEHNAFIEHCKSSEIYRVGYISKGFLDEEPQGEMAWDDWFRSMDFNEDKYFIKNGKRYFVYETKEVKVKGYDKNAPHTTTSLTNNNVVSAGE